MYDLSGKTALVTGAGGERGIGRAIALRLAREGADVAVNDVTGHASGSWRGLSAVAEEIELLGRRSLAITGDVADSSDVDHVIEVVLDHFGRIDILVNNAAAPAGPDRVPVVDLSEDVFDLVMSVNVKGTFLMCRAVARHLIETGDGGKIINLSSVSGKKGHARFAAYCASKFAVIGFTQSLALELAEHRINVNAICPSLVDTERVYAMASGLRPNDVSIEEYRELMVERSHKTNPLGRIGRPEDVARAAVWLASDEANYLTGQAINVSGGALMS